MTTLAVSRLAMSVPCTLEMNTLQFVYALEDKLFGDEYFSLAIPFFVSEFPLPAAPQCGFQCERFSRRVGGVPRRVRKVAFLTLPVLGSLTLANRVF